MRWETIWNDSLVNVVQDHEQHSEKAGQNSDPVSTKFSFDFWISSQFLNLVHVKFYKLEDLLEDLLGDY